MIKLLQASGGSSIDAFYLLSVMKAENDQEVEKIINDFKKDKGKFSNFNKKNIKLKFFFCFLSRIKIESD